MKKQLILASFCLYAMGLFAQSQLKGQLKHAKSDFILVEKPFQGQYLPGKPEKVEVKRNGKFEIDLADVTEGFLILRIDDHKLRVFVQPGSSEAELTADVEDWAGSVKFAGANAAQNEFLQGLPRLDLKSGQQLSQVENPFFKDGVSPKETWLEVTDHLEAEQKLLKKSARNGFSKAFEQAVGNDIQMYYNSIFGAVAYRKWKQAMEGRPYKFDAGWSNYWKKTATQDCLDNLGAAVSEWYLVLLEQYIREYRLDFLQENEFADASIERGEQFLEYDRLIWKYFKPNVQEYASAGIYSQAALLEKHEPILVELKDKFAVDFPNSNYQPSLESLLGLQASQAGLSETPAHEFASGINVIEDANSLKDLLSQFRGKVVYMDIWATWCTPCMFEFTHHEPLDHFAKGKDIVLLYVSVDNDERVAKWQKVIEEKHLTGYHVLANLTLRDELINQFGDGQNLALPTYLIFDKKGKLAVKDAKQPSHNTLLFKQLEEYLK